MLIKLIFVSSEGPENMQMDLPVHQINVLDN